MKESPGEKKFLEKEPGNKNFEKKSEFSQDLGKNALQIKSCVLDSRISGYSRIPGYSRVAGYTYFNIKV